MSAAQKPSSLLDVLADELGCACLSDLRAPAHRLRLIQALDALDPEAFSSAQWRESAIYLLGRETACSAAAQLRKELLEQLRAI